MSKKKQTNPNTYRRRSRASELWRNYKRNKGGMVGLIIVVIIIFVAIFAHFYYDFDADIVKQNIPERLQKPSAEHWFGTDQYGRDIFARLLYGSQYSIAISLTAMSLSCIVGTTLGLIAGYFGGLTENIILRVCEVFGSIPTILLGVAFMAAFGQSITTLIVAIGAVYVPGYARLVRASVLPLRDQEFIEAARVTGVSDFRIIFTHILPNVLSPLIVRLTMGVASGILSASALSFLGMGIPAPAPEWGAMLSGGRDFIRDYSYMTFFPGLAIMITVLGFNLMGDGLRDAMDPKLKQ